MTISADYAPNIDLGNGSTLAFAVDFPFAATSDLSVTLFDTSALADVSPAPVLNGGATYDYTVSGTPDPGTGIYPNGTVTFNTAPAGTLKVIRARSTAERQNISLIDNARFPAKTVEGGLDRLQMQLQETSALASRAIVAPAADGPVNLTLDPAATRADTILAFDGSGNVAGLPRGPVDAAVAAYLGNAVPDVSKSAFASSLAAAKAMFAAPLVLATGLALLVAGGAAVADGYQGLFVYDASDSTSTFTGDGLGFVDNQSRRFKRVYDTGGLISLQWFGALGNDSTDNATPITNALSVLSAAGGGTLWVPNGIYRDSGSRTLAPKVSLVGCGMGVATLKHTSTTAVQFNMPAASDTIVDYGGNYIHGITFLGAGTGTTAAAFQIKNKTNIHFDTCEIDNYQYLVKGVRDAVGNSVTSIAFTGAMRFGRCKTAIYAARQWNGLSIGSSCAFFSFEDNAIIAYDCTGLTIGEGATFDGNPTTAGAVHIVLGGCSGFNIGSRHEGNPNGGKFIRLISAKDKDGNPSLGGVAIDDSRGGLVSGLVGSSGGGIAYVMELDGVQSVVSEGCRAGSGIGTAFAHVTGGTRGNTFTGCHPASGTVASFATAADADYNEVSDPQTGMTPQAGSSFTPVLSGAGSAGVGTYTTQTMNYSRIGNRVFFDIFLSWSAHTGTGAMQVSLPFPATAYATFHVRGDALDSGTVTALSGYVGASASIIHVERFAAGAVTDVNIEAAASLIISGNYAVA